MIIQRDTCRQLAHFQWPNMQMLLLLLLLRPLSFTSAVCAVQLAVWLAVCLAGWPTQRLALLLLENQFNELFRFASCSANTLICCYAFGAFLFILLTLFFQRYCCRPIQLCCCGKGLTFCWNFCSYNLFILKLK